MKSGFMRKIIAVGVILTLFLSDVPPIFAQKTEETKTETAAPVMVKPETSAEETQTTNPKTNVTKEAASGTTAEGTVAEGTTAEGTVAEGTTAETTKTEGTTAETTTAEGTKPGTTAETVSESTTTEGTTTEGTKTEGTTAEKTVEDGKEEKKSSETESDKKTDKKESAEKEKDEKDKDSDKSKKEEAEDENKVISLPAVTVGDVTITVSGPKSAFAEGTTVSAVEVAPSEVVIEAAEEIEDATVKRYRAFDINLICDGKVVQPLNGEQITVNFEGNMLLPAEDKEEEVAVYHVSDDNNIEKMNAGVASMNTEEDAKSTTVEMTTTHFSTYVVMVTGKYEGEVNITVNHYIVDESGNKTVLFLPDKNLLVENGGTISGFSKESEFYTAQKLTVGEGKDETEITVSSTGECKIDVDSDTAVLNVYYQQTSGTKNYGVTMFDYTDGRADNSKSINYYKNYPSYDSKKTLETDKKNNWNKRFATLGAAPDYNVSVRSVDGAQVNANAYNGANDTQIIQGLLKNVSGEEYKDVNFTYEDPGFFTQDAKYGKKIINGYELKFNRNGFGYELNQVLNKNKAVVYTNNGQQFFPLKSETRLSGDTNPNNEYFGMRYDFKFVIGDYVGDMIYEFSGDDDVWVCLDGKVILDLGGVHGEVSGSVDVWKVLLGENTSYEKKAAYLASEANRTKVHTVTVLYMERGGSKSNCKMKFLMPNIVPNDPVVSNVPKANLNLIKRNSDTEETISGVGFTLYTDASCTTVKMHEQITSAQRGEEGTATFLGLRVGTYYLKETTYDENHFFANETVYKVEVTPNADGETATATLKDATGREVVKDSTTEGNPYLIYNTPAFGALKIVKTVDRVDAVHGNATFTFKITDPDGNVLYRTMTFEPTEEEVTKSVKIENLPLGNYKVEELNTLRYQLETGYNRTQVKRVTANQIPEYRYKNTKVFRKYYSHSDVAVNVVTFQRDEAGNITSATSRMSSSTGVSTEN